MRGSPSREIMIMIESSVSRISNHLSLEAVSVSEFLVRESACHGIPVD